MIYYFYHLDYHTKTPSNSADSSAKDTDPISWGNNIFAVPSNKKKQSKSTMSSKSYSLSFLQSTHAFDLIEHVNVYAIAEKFNISGLKLLATQKFDSASAAHWDTPEFLKAIHQVYTTTIESDRGLRNVVLRTLNDHSRLLDKGEIRAVLQQIHALAYELLIYKHTGDVEVFGSSQTEVCTV